MVLPSWDGQPLKCHWGECRRSFTTPEALYEHVSEDHVGRLRKKNFTPDCEWNGCGTTIPLGSRAWYDRGRMTSHLRFHIPLRVKCKFCRRLCWNKATLLKHITNVHRKELVPVVIPKSQLLRKGPRKGLRKAVERVVSPSPVSDSSPSARLADERWRRIMRPGKLLKIRKILTDYARKIKQLEDYSDDRAIKQALYFLKKCSMRGITGAEELRRHLKRLRADGHLTWDRLLEEIE